MGPEVQWHEEPAFRSTILWTHQQHSGRAKRLLDVVGQAAKSIAKGKSSIIGS